MKKTVFIFITVLLAALQGFCQDIDWQWAVANGGGGGSVVESWSAATDKEGNAYITGWTQGNCIFGNDTLTVGNGYCFYVVKYNSAGAEVWARAPQYQVVSESIAHSIATDGNGNVYITGILAEDSMVVGGITIHNPNNPHENIFTLSYDPSGNVRWVKTMAHGNTGTADWGWGIACDLKNNVYVTGLFSDTIDFAGTTLLNDGSDNLFVAKYDSAGNELWARCSTHCSDCRGYGIATDAKGGVAIAGWILSDSAHFGNLAVAGVNAGLSQILTVKYDSAGNAIWANVAQGRGPSIAGDYNFGAAEDPQGNTYITGTFGSDTIYFGGIRLLNARPGNSSYNLYIAKYDTLGQVLWVKCSTTETGLWGYGLALDTNKNIYVAGGVLYNSSNYFVYDSTTISFSTTPNDPMFVLTLDSNGHLLCSATLASGGDDASGICVDPYGNAFVAGDFDMINPIIIGADTLVLATTEDAFLAKFSCPAAQGCTLGPPAITTNSNTICANDSAYICAPTGFTTYQWNTGQTTPCFYTNQAGNYYVSVTDRNNCSATSNAVALTVRTPPQVSITVNHDTLTVNNGVSWQWFLNGSLLPGDTGNRIVASGPGQYTVQVTDSNGCTAASNAVTLGIAEVEPDGATIFPNPCHNSFSLTLRYNRKTCPITIYSSESQVVYETELNGLHADIDVHTLASGVFYVRIETPEGAIVKKLVKL